MKILVLNTGSSTVKFSLIESAGEATRLEGVADWSASPAKLTVQQPGTAPHETSLSSATAGAAVPRTWRRLAIASFTAVRRTRPV